MNGMETIELQLLLDPISYMGNYQFQSMCVRVRVCDWEVVSVCVCVCVCVCV